LFLGKYWSCSRIFKGCKTKKEALKSSWKVVRSLNPKACGRRKSMGLLDLGWQPEFIGLQGFWSRKQPNTKRTQSILENIQLETRGIWLQFAFHGEVPRLRRQRSEQYLTSSQHFSHFFRQVNERWQTGQIFVGRLDFVYFGFIIGDWRVRSSCFPV